MIPFSMMTPKEQIFSYIPDDPSQPQLHFAADRLVAWLQTAKWPATVIEVEKEFAEWCKENRGVEFHRLAKLDDLEWENVTPIVMCHMDDGSHLLVDGTHRYVWCSDHEVKTIKAWLVPKIVWVAFLIKDHPTVTDDYVKNGWSGF